jgi:hypothetical protein
MGLGRSGRAGLVHSRCRSARGTYWPTCSAETPERRNAPLRCSDVSFIVKHLPRAADPEAIARQAYAPTQGGWPHEIPQSRATDDEASAYID